MNKKAFTLVELLAVIVILGVLLSLVALTVNTYLNKTEETSFKALLKSIEGASEMYISDHSDEFPQLDVVGSTFNFQLQDLVENNYLRAPIIDEVKGVEIPLSTLVNVIVLDNNQLSIDLNYEQ